MKISNRILAVALSLGLCAFAVGCGSTQKVVDSKGAEVIKKVTQAPVRAEFTPAGEIKEGRKNIYAVIKTLNSSYWKQVVEGLKAGGQAADANLYIGATLREIDWESQKALLDGLEGKKVDGIVIAPADSTKIIPSLKHFRDKKVPVVLLDTAINSKDYDAGFMTNNVVAGMKAGEEMQKLLKKAGIKENEELTLRILQSSQTSSTIMDRLDGLNSYWTEKAPKSWKLNKMLLVDQGDKEILKKNTEKALKTSNIRGIFALNNSPTVSAAKMIQANNRKEVVLVGFDYGDATKAIIANADYKAASIVQDQYKMGLEAVKAATSIANGSKPSGNITDTGIVIVDKQNQTTFEAGIKK